MCTRRCAAPSNSCHSCGSAARRQQRQPCIDPRDERPSLAPHPYSGQHPRWERPKLGRPQRATQPAEAAALDFGTTTHYNHSASESEPRRQRHHSRRRQWASSDNAPHADGDFGKPQPTSRPARHSPEHACTQRYFPDRRAHIARRCHLADARDHQHTTGEHRRRLSAERGKARRHLRQLSVPTTAIISHLAAPSRTAGQRQPSATNP